MAWMVSLVFFSCVRGVGADYSRQDLHAFLLDNYFLLTRDEEHGKHVVVSRVSTTAFLLSANSETQNIDLT